MTSREAIRRRSFDSWNSITIKHALETAEKAMAKAVSLYPQTLRMEYEAQLKAGKYKQETSKVRKTFTPRSSLTRRAS